MARTLIRASPQVVIASRRAAWTGHRVVVCVDCIGDRRLYATTATDRPLWASVAAVAERRPSWGLR